MGEFRFTVPPSRTLSPQVVKDAYVAGLDGVPWKSHNTFEDGELIVDRHVNDSGATNLIWEVEGADPIALCTSSLMEREESYDLAIEVARGTLNRLRNQLANWQLAKLKVPADVVEQIQNASSEFFTALMNAHDPELAAKQADRAIQLAVVASDALAEIYSEQVLQIRHASHPRLSTLLGCNIGLEAIDDATSQQLTAAFNTATIPFTWAEIEPNDGEREWEALDEAFAFCKSKQLTTLGGPIVDFSGQALPPFLYLWEVDDFDELLANTLSYVRECVERYAKSVNVWHATTGTNMNGPLKLTEDRRLRLTVSVIELIRELDPKKPLIVSFDQPWGEYLANTPNELSPLHFADALVRADLGIAGLGLNFNLGWRKQGSLPRDLVQWSQQLDRWSLLGLPLIPLVTIRSESGEDSIRTASPETQAEDTRKILKMMLAKQPVQGIIWNQLFDRSHSERPAGGLFTDNGQAKPVLEQIRQLREAHL